LKYQKKSVPVLPLRTAIIGFGLSGKAFHAPFLFSSKKFTLVKILTTRTEEAKAAYPSAEVAETLSEILLDKSIEAVVVTSPNEYHFPHAKAALQNGKHVILEKPFAVSSEDGKKLIAFAKKKKKVLAVYQNCRWHGDFLTVKKIIASKALGDIVDFESHFDRYRPEAEKKKWRNQDRPGSGVLFDLGPHLIDQALVLFGDPEGIFADIRLARKKATVDDTFEIKLYYKTMRVTLKAGVLVKEAGARFAIHGTKGSFVKFGIDPQEAALRAGLMPTSKSWGSDAKEWFGVLNTEGKPKKVIPTERGNYMGFFDNVYEAIRNNKELEVTPQQALKNIRLIELAFKSSDMKRVINLKTINLK